MTRAIGLPRYVLSSYLWTILWMVAVPLFGQSVIAATESSGSPAPGIRFANQIHDFGKVPSGDTLKCEFILTNTGSALLVIKDVHSTCGCTRATNSSREVLPGKTSVISIEFRTASFTGPTTKTVTVSSNATNQPVATLELKANLWRPIDITPGAASFAGALSAESNSVRVIHITNNQENALLTLSEPRPSRREISAVLKTNQAGRDYELQVKLVPPLGSGNIFGDVQLTTSATNMPILTVPVWAIPHGQN